MNDELYQEMMKLVGLDPEGTTEGQESRLAILLDLHDSGMAYVDTDSTL